MNVPQIVSVEEVPAEPKLTWNVPPPGRTAGHGTVLTAAFVADTTELRYAVPAVPPGGTAYVVKLTAEPVLLYALYRPVALFIVLVACIDMA